VSVEIQDIRAAVDVVEDVDLVGADVPHECQLTLCSSAGRRIVDVADVESLDTFADAPTD
jgi:hypothetical protein